MKAEVARHVVACLERNKGNREKKAASFFLMLLSTLSLDDNELPSLQLSNHFFLFNLLIQFVHYFSDMFMPDCSTGFNINPLST